MINYKSNKTSSFISEFVGSNSPDDVRTATGAESPVAAGSPAESAATVIPASSKPTAPTATSEEVVDKGPSIGASSSSSATSQQHQHQEDAAGISCEMRRTPPQNKGHYLLLIHCPSLRQLLVKKKPVIGLF